MTAVASLNLRIHKPHLKIVTPQDEREERREGGRVRREEEEVKQWAMREKMIT